MKSFKTLSLFFLLSFLVVSCGSNVPAVNDAERLATMVAATVVAANNVEAAPDVPADGEPAPTAEVVVAPTQDTAAAPAPVAYPDFDGLRVAYIKDGNVYVWTEGDSPIGITSTNDAVSVHISDDGQLVAYVRELAGAPFAYELWVVNSDGAALNPRLLISHVEMGVLKAASQFAEADGFDFDQIDWRPRTHDIYYSTVPRFMGPGYAPNYDLRMVNADSEDKTTIFDFGQAGAYTFSPDGTQIALSTPDHISLVNADGSNLRASILTYPLVGTYSEYNYHPSPIWAADSASLRVAVPPEDTLAIPTPPTSLWYLPVDGSPATQLGSIPAIPFDWPDRAFSPDMSYVAYIKSVGEPTENQRELHIAYADGSNDYVVATGESLQFRGWAPDATRFVYAANGVDDQGLYLGSIAGGGAFTIASEYQTVRQMDWVDSSRIIFVFDYNGAVELRISDQDGNNHALIDTLGDALTSFDFTP